MIARRAGNLFEPQRYIWLCSKIELHIGIDRKRIEALLADPPPVTVWPHKPFIDGEVGLFAHGALDRIQAPFDFLLRQGDHMGRV